MGKLKFCANVSWMFKESPFLDRYGLAAKAGFNGVEAAWPYEFSIDELVAAKNAANIDQVLINTGCSESLGHAADYNKVQKFRDELSLGIKYANALDCKRVHVMAGFRHPEAVTTKAMATYVENLKYAADELQAHGLTGLIEPIQNKTMENSYFINKSVEAMQVLELVNKPNIKYQLDFFHVQLMEGNLTDIVRSTFPKIGHIQLSQVPKRNEPSTAGEIQYSYIFDLLEKLGYDGWIGCEYTPATTTVEGLEWYTNYMSL
uniref:Putative hydroxypyruvate isomerase n=1 Tax=Phallusia mammillata TaxID=59560 RepID=A0A6F9DEW2_9ASCI|nr:putative hydroxypyruvate isomerase [Phallusia mammillata]